MFDMINTGYTNSASWLVRNAIPTLTNGEQMEQIQNNYVCINFCIFCYYQNLLKLLSYLAKTEHI